MPQREDESLIEEMREAIRGDRERAAARGAAAVPLLESEPVRRPEPEPGPEPEPAKSRLRRLLGG